jgi:hypothetical protein
LFAKIYERWSALGWVISLILLSVQYGMLVSILAGRGNESFVVYFGQ